MYAKDTQIVKEQEKQVIAMKNAFTQQINLWQQIQTHSTYAANLLKKKVC
jgi:hypothetical protein